jgi:hypothetical protein
MIRQVGQLRRRHLRPQPSLAGIKSRAGHNLQQFLSLNALSDKLCSLSPHKSGK